ncbi:ATP-binding cassette domain-containing protein [Ornithinibacillus scapharcae]|uniref:ATP-binding cassette domain-containing protein n=1 Tax=Ornithinibacillus scapharcae TaxID=1147159 RepID=UPI000225BD6B|nr:ABC transporter ATP-binding protein [Ornithinibacillus scapharcae]
MISFRNINMRKGKKQILNSVDGDFVGSLGIYGENGAGKSTLLRLLAMIDSPTSGEIIYHDPKVSRKHLDYIGYLPQNFHGFQDYTVEDNLTFISLSKGLKDRKQRKSIISELLEELNLSSYRKVKLKHLSGGTIKRVGLSQALVSKPKVLILDEPTAGVDLTEQLRIRLFLNGLKEKGVKLIICSHNLEDLAVLTDNILTLKDGNIVSIHKTQDVINTKLKLTEIYTDLEGINNFIKEGKIFSFTKIDEGYSVRILSTESSVSSSSKEISNTEKLQFTLGSDRRP